MADHYETLGVAKNADPEAIKRAYRRKAQKAHPDRGGSSEKFHAIQRAYDVLGDEKRRARYDAGDEAVGGVDRTPEELAHAKVAGLILAAVVSCPDLAHHNIIEDCKGAVQREIVEHNRKIAEIEGKIGRAEDAIKRISRKKPGRNVVVELIKGDIATGRRVQGEIREKIEVAKLVISIFDDYAYRTDDSSPFGQYTGVRPAPMMGYWRTG